jgi:hypothetical protein
MLPPLLGDDGCPPIAEERRNVTLAAVARYGTDGFLVWICEGSDGLVYHGQRRDGDPDTDSLTVVATATSSGYQARSGGSLFEVTSSFLRVTSSSGERVVDDDVLASSED